MSKKPTLAMRLRKLAVSLLVLLVFLFPVFLTARWAYNLTGGVDHREIYTASQLTAFRDDLYTAETGNIKPFSEPLITITFDDGWESVYSRGLPVLEKYGIDTTQYILGGQFDNYLYLSKAQVQSLKELGHEIGSHTMTHAKLTTLSNEDLLWELGESSRVLTDEFGKVQDFAAPLGASNDSVLSSVKQYYRSHRNTVGDVQTIEDEDINVASTFDRYNINAYTVDATTTTSDLKRLIEHTKKRNGWLILIYHQVDDSNSEYAVTPEKLDKQMKFIRDSNIKIPVMGQVLDAIETHKQRGTQ